MTREIMVWAVFGIVLLAAIIDYIALQSALRRQNQRLQTLEAKVDNLLRIPDPPHCEFCNQALPTRICNLPISIRPVECPATPSISSPPVVG